MTHHVDDIPGLLAAPQNFYVKARLGETGAYALEWINAFAHLPPDLRSGLVLHGGTPAQLHLGPQQRLSRDVDLLGRAHGRIERVLDAIASRYDGRLFRWEETIVEGAEIDLQRFSTYFRNTAGEEIPLKIDVTYLPVELDTIRVRLAQSGVYVPLNADDAVETLTAQAFIADKLPTLGFDTLGYRRVADELGHPEHVWKQLHDLSRLVVVTPKLDRVPELYEHGITARNRARGLKHSPDGCVRDAYRVSMLSLAAAAYPYNDDRPSDPNYVGDVQHLRGGIGRFAQHLTTKPTPYDDAATTALLASGLVSVRTNQIAINDLEAVLARLRELANSFGANASLQKAVAARFDTATNAPGWDAPVSSRQLYRRRPPVVMTTWTAGNVANEANALRKSHRFTFEPAELSGG